MPLIWVMRKSRVQVSPGSFLRLRTLYGPTWVFLGAIQKYVYFELDWVRSSHINGVRFGQRRLRLAWSHHFLFASLLRPTVYERIYSRHSGWSVSIHVFKTLEPFICFSVVVTTDHKLISQMSYLSPPQMNAWPSVRTLSAVAGSAGRKRIHRSGRNPLGRRELGSKRALLAWALRNMYGIVALDGRMAARSFDSITYVTAYHHSWL